MDNQTTDSDAEKLELTEANVRTVAEQVRAEMSFDEWPHCGEISGELAATLPDRITDIASADTSILTFNISCGYRYVHYTVEIDPTGVESMIVDASFDQFAEETGTPVSVATQSDIEPIVVVQPAHDYIFYCDRTAGIL